MKDIIKGQNGLYIIIWLAIFILSYFNNIQNVPYENKWLPFIAIIIPLIPPVYINFWLIDKFLVHKRYFIYFLSIFGVLVVFGYLTVLLGNAFISIKYSQIYDGLVGQVVVDYKPFYAPALCVLFFSAIKFSIAGMQHTIIVKEIEAEKAKAEFSALKAQINPHFLFNTLNTLFSMASVNNDEQTAQGIAKLAHLMQYMIYDSKTEKIALKKEVNHIHNFIEINKLRFEESVTNNLKIEIKSDIDSIQIPPLLLMPFVENAFKHGHSVNSSFLLHILLFRSKNILHFEVKNSINKNKLKEVQSGFGLENLRKSLDLLYKKDYKLKINNENEIFTAKLEIPI